LSFFTFKTVEIAVQQAAKFVECYVTPARLLRNWRDRATIFT